MALPITESGARWVRRTALIGVLIGPILGVLIGASRNESRLAWGLGGLLVGILVPYLVSVPMGRLADRRGQPGLVNRQDEGKALLESLHAERAQLFSDVIQPDERVMETSAATMVEGLGWPAIPRTLDPNSNLVLTDRRILYRDYRGSAGFPWTHVESWHVDRAGHVGQMRLMAYLTLRLNDGTTLKFGCGRQFVTAWISLLAAFKRDQPSLGVEALAPPGEPEPTAEATAKRIAEADASLRLRPPKPPSKQ